MRSRLRASIAYKNATVVEFHSLKSKYFSNALRDSSVYIISCKRQAVAEELDKIRVLVYMRARLVDLLRESVSWSKVATRRGGARHFHLGGPLEGPVLQQGELSMVCVGLSERDLHQWHDVTRKILGGALGSQAKFRGAVAPPGAPLAPPLSTRFRLNVCWCTEPCRPKYKSAIAMPVTMTPCSTAILDEKA